MTASFTSPIEVAKLAWEPSLGMAKLTYHTVANSATELHDLLGGYLEVVRLPHQNAFDGLIGLVDEDGTRPDKQLSYNFPATMLANVQIVGPMLIVRALNADFVSLTDRDKVMLGTFMANLTAVQF